MTTPRHTIIDMGGFPAYLFPDGRIRPLISGGEGPTTSRRDQLVAEAAELVERSEVLEGDDLARFETIEAEVARLDRIVDQRAAVARMADKPSAAISGDGAAPARPNEPGFHINTRTKVDEAYDLTTIDRSRDWDAEIVGRARAVIEDGDGWASDDHREGATRTVQRLAGSEDRGRAVEQILLAASPAYRTAFLKHARNTEAPGSADDFTAEERHRMREVDNLVRSSGFWVPVDATEARALALTNITGKLVPSQLDTSVILTNDGAVNPFRSIARVIPVGTNVWTGVSSAGITAGWTGDEGTEVDDDAPTFSNPSVTCYMSDAFVPISFQGYDDWGSAAESELEMLFADAFDRLEEAAFATGSGSNQPTGVVTALAAVTNSRVAMATNGTFAIGDLYSLKQALPDRWKPRGRFASAEEILDTVRQFGTSDNYHGFTVDLNAGDLTAVFGKPWHQSTTMSGTLDANTNNSVVYGDFGRGYVIADRVGMVVEFIQNIFSPTNGRPRGQRGWLAHKRVGADVIVPGALRLLQNPSTL